jgi:hypothetical protein
MRRRIARARKKGSKAETICLIVVREPMHSLDSKTQIDDLRVHPLRLRHHHDSPS